MLSLCINEVGEDFCHSLRNICWSFWGFHYNLETCKDFNDLYSLDLEARTHVKLVMTVRLAESCPRSDCPKLVKALLYAGFCKEKVEMVGWELQGQVPLLPGQAGHHRDRVKVADSKAGCAETHHAMRTWLWCCGKRGLGAYISVMDKEGEGEEVRWGFWCWRCILLQKSHLTLSYMTGRKELWEKKIKGKEKGGGSYAGWQSWIRRSCFGGCWRLHSQCLILLVGRGGEGWCRRGEPCRGKGGCQRMEISKFLKFW